MKPGEDMHSAVEEVDVDPCDLYLDLGALIVEGRIPGLTDRGFGEGPHCPNLQSPQNRHHCAVEAPECQRYEQIQKHMLLLWKNGIPMSIEVLLYPSCCIGVTPAQSVDTSSVPDMSYILLEQWTVHMICRRVPDASINPRGLMQAIRSFLYFSQLCAWFSLSGGKSPQNVHYRVCVPGEAFSSRFSAPPECHVFPIANIGRNAAMKVTVKSHPRFGEIPSVPCHKHLAPFLPSKAIKPDPKYDTLEEEVDGSPIGAEGEIIDGVLPTESQQTSRTSSPADVMLGESLLDPPHSLCMYPKRYQSPSRCGSPSLEVPEHLMFGKGAKVKREVQRQRLNSDMQGRSRPHQRPVIQHVLQKSFNDSLRASASSGVNYEKCQSRFDDVLKALDKDESSVSIDLRNFYCVGDDLNSVSPAEMETVLCRLRNRCSGARNTQDKKQIPYLLNSNKNLSKTEHTLEKNLDEANFNKLSSEFAKLSISSNLSQNHLYGHTAQAAKFNIESENLPVRSKVCEMKAKSQDLHSTFDDLLLNDEFDAQNPMKLLETNKVYRNQKSISRVQGSYFTSADTSMHFMDKKSNKALQPIPAFPENVKKCTYQLADDDDDIDDTRDDIFSNLSGVNIKKCGALLESLSTEEKLIDERKLVSAHLTLPSQKLAKATSSSPSEEECDVSCPVIPSAEDKAQFRRSLDSATSLVFHKKSGLPLTSSPAPIRKSGTCFDFDSSLTSVSAIKRALFEKEALDDETQPQRSMHVSISAPASMAVSSLLGTFEESVLNGRLEPVSTVEGFTAEIGASGSFCPRHITLPVTIFFYTLQDIDKVTSPYLGHINLGQREYHIPKSGTVQATLFNPHHTVVKMFVVRYDLRDMPPNCQTFLRQRTLYMPTDASGDECDAQKWLRYLIHLRFASSKSGRISLHTDIRMIIFRKSDLDAATVHEQWPYELRSFTQGPVNPKFSPRKL